MRKIAVALLAGNTKLAADCVESGISALGYEVYIRKTIWLTREIDWAACLESPRRSVERALP